jgi:hypothetical protein
MQKRKLLIVKRSPHAIGICERCNSQFKSSDSDEDVAMIDIGKAFADHKCKRLDESQNALRVVREATED